MNNLYISHYPEKDKARKAELLTCLKNNSTVFDQVFVLTEGDAWWADHQVKNIIQLPVTKRPTFKTFFNAINHVSHPDDINVIANSDIYFEHIDFPISIHDCYALTRYEKNGVFLNRRDSQDAWIFRGHVRFDRIHCQFEMGRPGCDNRIAWELSTAGYKVTNPSLSIKTHHIHSNPTDHSQTVHRIDPPYMRLEPSFI